MLIGRKMSFGGDDETIPRIRCFFICLAAGLFFVIPSHAAPAHAGASQAKAMLMRAVAALKADPAEAIAKFNRADGRFRSQDLYVVCFDANTGAVQSHSDPKQLGVEVRRLKRRETVWQDAVRRRQGGHPRERRL